MPGSTEPAKPSCRRSGTASLQGIFSLLLIAQVVVLALLLVAVALGWHLAWGGLSR